jgi:hypothetical protein
MGYDLRREVRIANGVVARWRENVERKKIKRKKEKERGGSEVFRELSRVR